MSMMVFVCAQRSWHFSLPLLNIEGWHVPMANNLIAKSCSNAFVLETLSSDPHHGKATENFAMGS
jgi:hypothetical protein